MLFAYIFHIFMQYICLCTEQGLFKVTCPQKANKSEINRGLTLSVHNYWDKRVIFRNAMQNI